MTKKKNSTDLKRLANREIKDGIIFGIDVGIASCGWAVINTHQNKIIAMGSRCFEKSEDNDRKLLNVTRREKRGSRRLTVRHQGRMRQVRKLIQEYKLLCDPSHEHFHRKAPDPWEARIKGLDQRLTKDEVASVLMHIAKHRGFKSNRKGDANDTEGGKVKRAVADLEKYSGERTYPQVLMDWGEKRKRNRPDDYKLTPPRSMIEDEAREIISKQREKGAEWATQEFEERFINAAFYQIDLRSSEGMVGKCIHEKERPRTSRFSYSYEKYRLLESLIHKCKISNGQNEYLLTPEQLKVAVDGFGNRSGLTFQQLRKLLKDNKLGLPDDHRFVNAKTPEEEKNEEVTTVKSRASTGSYTLRKALPKDEWKRLTENPHILDEIAEIITFNESLKEIQEKLSGLPLDPETVDLLMDAVDKGGFKSFKGAGHISSKAARNLIPEMLKGKNYHDACVSVGYNPTASREVKLGEVGSAVAKRSVIEAIKQVAFLVHEYGRPERISIELMREVGKSAKVRGEITAANNRRTSEKKNNKTQFLEETQQIDCSDDALERFELLKEQGYQCPYCEKPLRSSMIVSDQPQVEIEHIYPLSRSADNTYQNKVLSCITCNQDKRDRTPWEWIGGNNEVWAQFEARVNLMYPTSSTKKRGENKKREKKKRLLDKTFNEREQNFINRNQVDTSYAARALTTKLTEMYPEEGRYVFAIPGPITGMVRKSWLKQHWKKDRNDDRHHAMDALIVALIDSKILPKVTREHQKYEELGRYKFNLNVPPPWDTFPEDAIEAYNSDWLVCRTENRRVRGALHEETIRRMRVDDDDNEIYYERKSIDDLTANHIKLIPDPVIQAEVQRWFDAGKSKDKDDRPKSANGDEIRRLRLPTKIKTARQINPDSMGGKNPNRQGGFVENSNMVRVDVFRVPLNTQDCQFTQVDKGYYIVPVYGFDIIHKDSKTPLRAVGGKGKSGPIMDPDHFVMSLYKDSYVKVTYANGNIKEGYYREADIGGSGSVALSLHHRRHRKEKLRGIGVRSLKSIRKFHVDRFGQMHEIPLGSEKWPGYRDKSEHHKKQPES